MKTVIQSLALISTLFTATLHAVETYVTPGVGTLQAAIDAAEEGDTLILTSGSYSDSDDVINIIQTVTIRAESKNSDVHILAQVRIPDVETVDVGTLVLQGLNFSSSSQTIAVYAIGNVEKIYLLENTLSSGISINPVSQARENLAVYLVGNNLTCALGKDSTYYSISANIINILGNNVCNDRGVNLTTSFYGSGPAGTIIGNEFLHKNTSSSFIYTTFNEEGTFLMAGNRLTRSFFEVGSDITNLNASVPYYFVRTSSKGSYDFRNNIFKIDTSVIDTDTDDKALHVIHPIEGLERTSFVNNVVDFGNIEIVQPTEITDTDGPAAIDEAFLRFEGNIFVNYTDRIIEPNLVAGLKNNLCFNNTENCGTENGNLNADPLFTDPDNGDYSLQESSPAIDAGSVELRDYDTDGTRNDIGAYAGSWSIEQYDAQRSTDATGPYIYPLLEASKGVANGSLRIKFVSYPRLK